MGAAVALADATYDAEAARGERRLLQLRIGEWGSQGRGRLTRHQWRDGAPTHDQRQFAGRRSENLRQLMNQGIEFRPGRTGQSPDRVAATRSRIQYRQVEPELRQPAGDEAVGNQREADPAPVGKVPRQRREPVRADGDARRFEELADGVEQASPADHGIAMVTPALEGEQRGSEYGDQERDDAGRHDEWSG